ncbi:MULTISPECIES: hypothetical protein [Methylorubrum]|uniref:hypothetical protein n=1 Tax=Methylorubrum TaxID=2282523 RepID=UPI00209DC0C0|nr:MULTISPECIES: hypothetical protein [Methylorubrum]MCP1550657.1 hypothetical protein [Methylorubrum zatmanii]MCP1552730.1 hypothetical protein [Methylorubrum extorquens]MCP1580960.1 hypothetical protein [Methylorubrum extorquens]
MAAPRTIPDEADIMRLVRAGLTYTEIEFRLRVPRHRVSRIATAHGYDSSKRIKLKAQKRAALRARQRAKAAFEKAKAEAERRRRLGERDPLRRIPAVPAWAANAGLTQDYRDFAREFDEDRAARECRKLTAERRRQEVFAALTGANPRKGGAA